jgi:hypothetical protein
MWCSESFYAIHKRNNNNHLTQVKDFLMVELISYLYVWCASQYL